MRYLIVNFGETFFVTFLSFVISYIIIYLIRRKSLSNKNTFLAFLLSWVISSLVFMVMLVGTEYSQYIWLACFISTSFSILAFQTSTSERSKTDSNIVSKVNAEPNNGIESRSGSEEENYRRKKLNDIKNDGLKTNRMEDSSNSKSIQIVEEPDFYKKVWEEIECGNIEKGMWARFFSEENGNENKAKAKYIKYRVSQLKEENELKQKQ